MKIDIEDILITLIGAERETDKFKSLGRTIIQKKVYFLNELLNLRIRYKPHFFI